MKASYLGLELSGPVIVSSSPYTSDMRQIELCARHGAGAVVLKSIFEEQILQHAAALSDVSDSVYGDAEFYLFRYLGDDYKSRFLHLIGEAKEVLPVIASINCVAGSDEWIDYAQQMAGAGASAIELNIFLQPTDRHASTQEIEHAYTQIAGRVAHAVQVPVSVKMPMRLTNVLATGDALHGCGVRGLVLFNRFFEPDVDIERMDFVESSPYSDPSEIRNVLRTTALCSAELPQLDLSVSTGVHDGAAVVKALLCGARAAQVCTAIHLHGFEVIGEMNRFVDEWAARHGFASIEDFRGRMNFRNSDSPLFQRVQYMKYFPSFAR